MTTVTFMSIFIFAFVAFISESISKKSDSTSDSGKDSPLDPNRNRRDGDPVEPSDIEKKLYQRAKDKPESSDDGKTLSLKDLEKGITVYISTTKPGGDKS